MSAAVSSPASAGASLRRRALDLRGVEAAIECANVITEQATEIDALRAAAGAAMRIAGEAAEHLREGRAQLALALLAKLAAGAP